MKPNRMSGPRAIAWMVIGFACWSEPATPGNADPQGAPLKTIVVTAKIPDDEVEERVESAMRSDPYFNDAHVTVTIKDGVITLQGIVFDEWDLRQAIRISKKVTGVKRVINQLEIQLGGE